MAVVLVAGCKGDDEYVVKDDSVLVKMAYTLNSKSTANQTRMANVGGILPSKLRIVALNGRSPMKSLLSWNTSGTTSSFYHFDNCPLAVGTNRCLVYGDTEPSNAISYGGLNSSIPTVFNSVRDVRSITFDLMSIYDGASAPSEATTLATALKTVANIDGWKTSTNEVLKNLRKNFTNDGFNLPGSAADVKQWLLALAVAAQSILDDANANIGEDEKTILGNVKSTATTTAEGITVSENSYPREYNLPDGAAVLRWVEATSSFEPQIETTTLNNVTAMWRYAYPAPLYYFCDSPIKTSDNNVNSTSTTSWDSYLNHFPKSDGFVTTTTKAVALSIPVEYAVAQLKVLIKASDVALPDNTGTAVTVGTDRFKLTGIVVCGQRPVDYSFVPANNSEEDMKFIYDRQVNPNYYLAKTEAATEACNTLVLQSYDGENVNIILEFENMSNDMQFKSIDGFVYPHTRFYLIGKVLATGGTGGVDSSLGRVFTKDCITTVNVTISSLANAYSVLPNLLSSNLAIGLEATPQWTVATPTTARLE